MAQAQSTIPQAVNEPLNLAPRMLKGDTQDLYLDVEYFFLDTLGFPTGVKTSSIDFSLLCLANTPDSGLLQQVTVNELRVGGRTPVEDPMKSHAIVTAFEGFSFLTRYRTVVPVKNDCYDFDINLRPDQFNQEGYDFFDNFIPYKVIEQIRLALGQKLTYVGDTVTFKFPKPICFNLPKVINNYRLEFAPWTIILEGVTRYNGIPCAIVSFESNFDYLQVEIYSTPKTSIKAEGSSCLYGQFLVSLNKGLLVKATFHDRSDTEVDWPNGTSRLNRVLKTYELRQK